MPPKDIAIALSGGGYRAAFFNLGVLRKLDELDLLDRVAVISSVSGGSIVAGAYAQSLLVNDSFAAFFERMSAFLFGTTLDAPAILGGLVPWRSSSWRLERAFGEFLGDYQGRPVHVSDLANIDGPRFVFNSTAVHSGRGWRFISGGVAEEWELGQGHDASYVNSVDTYECDVPLAKAVTASAAFPLFSAVTIPRAHVRPRAELTRPGPRRFFQDLTDPVCLVDGGVRDNTGLSSIVAGQAPCGFENDYYLIGSDAGATLSLLTDRSQSSLWWLNPAQWFAGPPRGRFRKLHYVLRQFEVMGHHNNQLTVAMVLAAHRARPTSDKGMAMLRIDEAIIEAGELADQVGRLVTVKTRLKSPGRVVGSQLITHGGNLLWARLSEYTDLLSEAQRMRIPRRKHKDVQGCELSASPPITADRMRPVIKRA